MGSNNQLGARIVMSTKNFEDAKAVFDKYDGSYYQMVRDGQYEKYKRYCVPKSLEKEWLKSKQNAEYKELLRSKNMYKTAHAFDMYCHFTSLLGDKNGIRIAEEYISDNMTIQDTWTLIREISTYTDLLRAFKAFDHKKKAKIIKFLKELLERNITISDDYKKDGVFPDYLTEEKVREDIVRQIKYWKVN